MNYLQIDGCSQMNQTHDRLPMSISGRSNVLDCESLWIPLPARVVERSTAEDIFLVYQLVYGVLDGEE